MKTAVKEYNGIPALFINDRPVPGALVYASPARSPDFAAAGLHIYNAVVGKHTWWSGPDTYSFTSVDSLLEEYLQADPDALFFPRICIGYVEDAWWHECFPGELSEARYIESGELVHMYGDQHRLRGSGASFASDTWLLLAGKAISVLVRHLENGLYADRIIGYHIGAGISGEWFAWNTFEPDRIEDYSTAMQYCFRNWLKEKYGNDDRLRKAWYDCDVSLDSAEIPIPAGIEGDAKYLETDTRIIDYRECFSAVMVDAVTELTLSAKQACNGNKVVGVFFGYFWPHRNITNPARAGHACLRDVCDLDSVDIIMSPSHYDNRGTGGFMDAQSLPDTVRRHGKLFLHEIDTPTSLNRVSLRPWMANFDIPQTTEGSVHVMTRDWAAAAVKCAAYWWMDLYDDGWFSHPDFVEHMNKLNKLDMQLLQCEWQQTAEVAVVLSEQSCYRQKLYSAQRYWYLSVLRQWSLSRAGFPFDSVLLEDLLQGSAPPYRLYLFPDLYYMPETAAAQLKKKLDKQDACAIYFHAPGCLSDTGCSAELMSDFLGVPCNDHEYLDAVVELCDENDPILAGLPAGTEYGLGINTSEIDATSATNDISIDTVVQPAFTIAAGAGKLLGTIRNTELPGLVRIQRSNRWDLYSFAPAPPWQLLRNAAREADVHIWCKSGDGVYADNRIIALHAVSDGEKSIRFPKAVDISDPFSGEVLKRDVKQHSFLLKRGETKLLKYSSV
jgi:hypothetical protein